MYHLGLKNKSYEKYGKGSENNRIKLKLFVGEVTNKALWSINSINAIEK